MHRSRLARQRDSRRREREQEEHVAPTYLLARSGRRRRVVGLLGLGVRSTSTSLKRRLASQESASSTQTNNERRRDNQTRNRSRQDRHGRSMRFTSYDLPFVCLTGLLARCFFVQPKLLSFRLRVPAAASRCSTSAAVPRSSTVPCPSFGSRTCTRLSGDEGRRVGWAGLDRWPVELRSTAWTLERKSVRVSQVRMDTTPGWRARMCAEAAESRPRPRLVRISHL
jgi:hypothetical protein